MSECRRRVAWAVSFLPVAVGLLGGEAGATDEVAARDATLRRWSPDYATRCLLEGTEGPAELRDLVARLSSEGPLSGYLTDLLSSSQVTLCLDPQTPGCRGYFEPGTRIIALSPDLTSAEKALVAVHELRHVDQLRRGFAPQLSLDRREYTRLVFALEADAQALTTFYAWSELDAGRPDLWSAGRTLANYEDVADAFADELDASGDRILATRAAFATWYHSDLAPSELLPLDLRPVSRPS